MSEIKRDKATLVFTGDIGFDRYMDGKWDDEELLSKEVLAFLHSADHVIANVEGPLVDQATNTTTEGVQQLMHTMNPAGNQSASEDEGGYLEYLQQPHYGCR